MVLRSGVFEDVRATIDYLAVRNVDAAERFASAVPATLDGLTKMPGKGSPRKFRSKRLSGIRSWPVDGFRKYLIFYRPIEGGIEVLAIVHGARNLPQLLKLRV